VLFVRELKLTSTDTGFPFSAIKEKSTAPTNDTLKNEIDGLKDIVENLEEEIVKLVPKGIIVMWSGSIDTIPNGWVLCDGNNGTPDLTRRFIYGAGNDLAPNIKGGDNHRLLMDVHLPKHRHHMARATYQDPSSSSELKKISIQETDELAYRKEGYGSNDYILVRAKEDDRLVCVTNGSIVRDGNGNKNNRTPISTQEKLNIMPAYYTLAYIMKL
jgi:hypothetical protein